MKKMTIVVSLFTLFVLGSLSVFGQTDSLDMKRREAEIQNSQKEIGGIQKNIDRRDKKLKRAERKVKKNERQLRKAERKAERQRKKKDREMRRLREKQENVVMWENCLADAWIYGQKLELENIWSNINVKFKDLLRICI